MLGAEVILSDGQQFPTVRDAAMRNCQLNNITDHIRYVGITWGRLSPSLLTIGPVDIIIASDCFYNSSGLLLEF